jgi:hypothetical protein
LPEPVLQGHAGPRGRPVHEQGRPLRHPLREPQLPGSLGKFENLGLISLSGTSSDEFTDPMKADVEKAACHMGGDVVSLNVSAPGMFQFIVWRAK